jgi:hypothetical protein
MFMFMFITWGNEFETSCCCWGDSVEETLLLLLLFWKVSSSMVMKKGFVLFVCLLCFLFFLEMGSLEGEESEGWSMIWTNKSIQMAPHTEGVSSSTSLGERG